MAIVTIHEAKTNLSKLIARAQKGEEIVIVSARTGVELGRIRLRPLTDLAQSGVPQ